VATTETATYHVRVQRVLASMQQVIVGDRLQARLLILMELLQDDPSASAEAKRLVQQALDQL
jgi:hypothetical protein